MVEYKSAKIDVGHLHPIVIEDIKKAIGVDAFALKGHKGSLYVVDNLSEKQKEKLDNIKRNIKRYNVQYMSTHVYPGSEINVKDGEVYIKPSTSICFTHLNQYLGHYGLIANKPNKKGWMLILPLNPNKKK